VTEFLRLVQAGVEAGRQPRVAQRGEQHARRTGRITVRVHPAAAGNNDGLVKVTPAKEQAHENVGAVDLAVDATLDAFWYSGFSRYLAWHFFQAASQSPDRL